MRETVVFLAYAVPYFAFAGVSVIIGAAFFVPNLVFETFGTVELMAVVLVAAVSLVLMATTKERMHDAGQAMLQRRYDTESSQE